MRVTMKPMRVTTNLTRVTITQRKTQCELMEYSLRWVFTLRIRVGCVDFMLFVSISFRWIADADTVSGGI